MTAVFADTFYWIALADSADSSHRRAIELDIRIRRRFRCHHGRGIGRGARVEGRKYPRLRPATRPQSQGLKRGSGSRWVVELLPRARAGLAEILEEHGDDAFDQALDEILALEESNAG